MPPVNTPAVTSPATVRTYARGAGGRRNKMARARATLTFEPQRSPTRPQTPNNPGRPLTPLSYLSSPAPDLASTLYTSQAAEEADEANVSFLRDSLESLDQAGSQQQPQRRSHVDAQRDPRRAEYLRQTESQRAMLSQQSQRETQEDLSRRERLQRVLARLNRLHDPSTSSATAYTNRTPSPNRQSLYDWAPAYDEHSNQEENELDAILGELRRQQPDTHPDILRVLSQSQLEGHRQRDRDANGSSASGNAANGNAANGNAAHGSAANGSAANETTESDRRRRTLGETRRREEWASLRSRAVLQRARQEGAASPSATERVLRYVMDRERSGMSEEEERARGAGWFRPTPSRGGNEDHRNRDRDSWTTSTPANILRERDRQERVEQFRRGYLAENAPPRLPRISTPPVPVTHTSQPNAPSTFLENALKYLSELRTCSRYEDSLSTAMDHGLATKEFFADKHEDFVMDLDELPPLQDSSWLQPGAIFDGHQHATTGSSNLTHQGPPAGARIEQINPNFRSSNGAAMGFDHPPGSTRVVSFDGTRPWFSHQPSSLHAADKEPHDQWPVRVIIHSIDPQKLTLQGTMEAYDVPQHPSSLSIMNSTDRPKAGRKNAPITTYLEGHIIDLRTHSFLTPEESEGDSKSQNGPRTSISDNIAFPSANPHTDAQNWLKLPPFRDLIADASPSASSNSPASEDHIARHLLSKHRLAALHNQYIFMRWKERCFVHAKNDPCSASHADRSSDQDRGHGLTISGFYYVSLRRTDGAVEGLYFDPTSTPYQCLRLKGAAPGWGAWDFR